MAHFMDAPITRVAIIPNDRRIIESQNKCNIFSNKPNLDRKTLTITIFGDIIKDNIEGYELDRIYKVDLAILVLAIYELKFENSTPDKVVLNEAIELSKKYSTDKSFSFINGVLAKILK